MTTDRTPALTSITQIAPTINIPTGISSRKPKRIPGSIESIRCASASFVLNSSAATAVAEAVGVRNPLDDDLGNILHAARVALWRRCPAASERSSRARSALLPLRGPRRQAEDAGSGSDGHESGVGRVALLFVDVFTTTVVKHFTTVNSLIDEKANNGPVVPNPALVNNSIMTHMPSIGV